MSNLTNTHELRSKIGAQLKDARLKANLTYTQLAEFSGVNRSTLCQIENGKWSASVDMLERIMAPLNVTLKIE